MKFRYHHHQHQQRDSINCFLQHSIAAVGHQPRNAEFKYDLTNYRKTKYKTRNVGQCPTWWSPCRIQVAPSVQRHKVWLTPTTRCCAVALPRRETRWNLQACPKLVNRSQPLVGRSSPYCGDMCRTYCCLTSFFPIVDTCLSCEDITRQSCAMVPRWLFLATFLRPVFSASHVQQVSDLHLKFALRPHHVELWQTFNMWRLRLGEGKKEERRTNHSMKI